MQQTASAYGLWGLVIVNSLMFIIFAFNFFKPSSPRDWPTFAAVVLIMLGFLLQWPTLLTLLMFPVLVLMYVHLARQEERWAEASFAGRWHAYSARVPAFFPHLGTPSVGKEQQP
jgi:hypothetical protein